MSEQSKFNPANYSLEVYENRLDSTYKAINDGLNHGSADGDLAQLPQPDQNAATEQNARDNHDRIALFRDVLPQNKWAGIPVKDPATYRWLQTSTIWSSWTGGIPNYVIGEREVGRKNVEILSMKVARSDSDKNYRAEIKSNTVRKKDWHKVLDDNMALVHTPLDEEETMEAYDPKTGMYVLKSMGRYSLSLAAGSTNKIGILKPLDRTGYAQKHRPLVYDFYGTLKHPTLPEDTMSKYNVYRHLSHLALAFNVQKEHTEIFSMNSTDLNGVRPSPPKEDLREYSDPLDGELCQ